MKTIQTMSIDLAKNFIQVLALDQSGNEVFNRKVPYAKLKELVQTRGPKKILMESCSTAHYWGREFGKLGSEVMLIPPQRVAQMRVGDKNDANDCWAIFEASTRPKLKPVSVKSEEHQLLQTWLRRRDSLVANRTERVNAVRSYLAEAGYVIAKGIYKFRKAVIELLQQWNGDLRLKEILEKDIEGLNHLAEQISFFDGKISLYAKTNATCIALQKLGGIGPITAVALVASVVNPRDFKNGRWFAASLGLVPRQHSTGGKTKLYGIGKDGNRFLRLLLIHGGRSLIWSAPKKQDAVSQWALRKKMEKGFNKASVAVANKNARMAWAVMAQMAA
jgi:transposase